MMAQAIAGPFDLDDDGVMQQAVQQRRGDDRIAKDLAPFGKAAIGGQDHGTLFVAGVDQLEEQVRAAAGDGQVADFIDDQQRCAGVEPDLFSKASFPFSLGQGLDQLS